MISENMRQIREKIAEAADKSGRAASDITLIGVTKTVPADTIRQLISAGITHIGENKVQEFLPKYVELTAEAPNWHFIGHLQKNKVKHLVGKISLIHSIDSLGLAQEINKRLEQQNMTQDVLIEINIAKEPTKYGILPEAANEFSKHIFALSNMRLRGLMCVAPFVENGEKNRALFAKMRELAKKIFLEKVLTNLQDLPYTPFPFELSMGMSGDYTAAIEEGATMVRIGTALVGERP